jgi:outer membrane protein
MKKFLLASNIALLIAVVVLYILYFNYTSSDTHKVIENRKAASMPFRIAYFELDSLQEQYIYLKEVRDNLNKKDVENAKILKAKQDAYYKRVKDYQQKGPTMSQNEQGQFEQQLMQMQNDLRTTQEEKNQEMQVESMRRLQEVKTKIQEFLKGYCKDKGYAYVFASSNDDYLYYKDTVRNITSDVVRLLNEQYKKSSTP